ncbi:response regulator [Teredinibacter purpureus]|uniref:response regulator n=1 Tax=Teredinibacter purpureus TaxID=2731756 RepID=UPI001F4348C8|nr:response regulator [Teredinibacter purpureus]
MPELTGLEVHCKAKASNKLQGAHFVMVTAVSESSRIREAIQQGVNDYIVKPIDMDVLEAKIKTALNIDDEPSTEDKKES